jgi:hypothetical protein
MSVRRTARRALFSAAVAVSLIAGPSAPARAEPVSIAILTAIGLSEFAVAGSVAVALTTFVLTTAAALGVSYLATALQSKKATQPTETTGGTTGRLQAGGALPRSFIVGRYMTAGSLAYGNTFGQAGNTPNAYFVQVIALSDIPVTGLAGLLVGGEPVTWNPGATPATEGIAIPEYASGGADHLWVRFYDGRQTTADARLVALFGSDPDRPYTDRRIGTGVAYAVVTALVDQELFSGFPACKFVLDGVPFYDRRFDSTAGGSGPQRLTDQSTWVLTSNLIVISENILRGISYAGQWLYGAQTVTGPQLPFASWTAAASECDVPIDLAGGGTEPQFAGGAEIRLDVQPADMLDELLKGCNGKLAEIGGTYKVRAGAAGAAVFSFTDADILSTEPQTFDPFPSLGQVINHVTAKYVSPAEAWNVKDAPPLQSSALEALDGGRRQSVNVVYNVVTSGTRVQRLMKSARDEQRAFRRHALPMPPEAFVLEPLDVVSWSSTRNGYVNKTFEIVSADDLPNLNMALAVRELDPNAYDWHAATDEQPVVDGTIQILRPPAQPIIDWFADPYTITAGAFSKPAILIGWDPNTHDVDGIRFEVRVKATSDVVLRDDKDANVLAIGALVVSQNLLPNTLYQARGQYRPASPRPVLWSNWLDVLTPNILVEPASLTTEVLKKFQEYSDRLQSIEDFVGEVVGRQDAANWLDKTSVKKTQWETRAALNTHIVTVEDDLDTTKAQVQTTTTALAALDGSFAAYRITVSVQFHDLSALVDLNASAIADLDGAFANYRITVTTQFADVIARVDINATAISTLDTAFGSFRVAVNATLGDHSSRITINADAFANLNGVFTSFQTTTSATLGSHSASIITSQNAIIQINGRMAAFYGLSVDADGHIASMQLASDGTLAGVRFRADVFQISLTGYTDLPPFSVGLINGAPALGFRGDAFFDGSVAARHLTADSITTNNLVADAATRMDAAAGNGSFAWYDGAAQQLLALPITSSGGKTFLEGSVTFESGSISSAADNVQQYDVILAMFMDGTPLASARVPARMRGSITGTSSFGGGALSNMRVGVDVEGTFHVSTVIVPAVGNHTIQLIAQPLTVGTPGPITVPSTLISLEAKR